MTSERKGQGTSEWLQITIMTLYMVAGACALFSAVLYFVVGAQAGDLARQENDANQLAALLDPRKDSETRMHMLRRQVREAQKASGDLSLRDRVERELGDIKVTNFPKSTSKPLGNSATVENAQTINVEGKMDEIVGFVARVKSQNPSVQVNSFRLNRIAARGGPAAGADEDRWTSDIVFHLFTSTGTARAGASKTAPAEGAGDAAAKETAASEESDPAGALTK